MTNTVYRDWKFEMWPTANRDQDGSVMELGVGVVIRPNGDLWPRSNRVKYFRLVEAFQKGDVWHQFCDGARRRYGNDLSLDFTDGLLRAWIFIPATWRFLSRGYDAARCIAAFLFPYLDEWEEFVSRVESLKAPAPPENAATVVLPFVPPSKRKRR